MRRSLLVYGLGPVTERVGRISTHCFRNDFSPSGSWSTLMLRSPIPLSLSALLMIIASACGLDGPDDRPVEPTVMAAEISGFLEEENGCLRVRIYPNPGSKAPTTAIVWQKDVLAIERRGDTVDIYAGEVSDSEAPIASWQLGDEIRGGGGSISRRIADEHAGAGFSERCEGPYFLVGDVS